MRPYLQLLRPANVATALADVLAGFAVAGFSHRGALPWLLASTCCLYGGGVVLNDVFDRTLDAVERPERPIPSGRVTAVSAARLGIGLLAGGIALASLSSLVSMLAGSAIAVAVVLYDAWGKRHAAIGPVNMGLCRALNLGLGMTATAGTLATHWPLTLIPWTYIAAVTLLSRGEVLGGSRRIGTVTLVLLAVVLAALVRVGMTSVVHPLPPLLVVVWLAWRILPPFVAARRVPSPAAIRRAVRTGVLSLVLLDAVIAVSYAGMIYGLSVLATALLAGWLARRFAVT